MNRKAAFTVMALVITTSCMVGPKYTKAPPAITPPAYTEQPPASFKDAGVWQPAKPGDSALRLKWWEIFGDPALNALEEQVEPANQTLKSAEANLRAAREQITVNRSALFPQIGASPAISNQHLSANRPFALGQGATRGDFSGPFDVTYEVDLWGRIRRSVTAAREEYQGSAADLETAKLSLHAELATDYYEARSLDTDKRLLDNTVTAYEKALTLAQNRFKGGVAARTDVAQAQTQLDSARAQDIDVGVARSQFEHAIAVLTGRPPEGFGLNLMPMGGEPPPIPVGIPSELLQRRPDIASAERRVAAANEQIGIAQVAFYPQLNLSAMGGFEGSTITNWFTWPSRFWAVGPQFSQFIFDAGRRRALVQIAQDNYDATVANYRQSTLIAFQNVEDALAELRILSQEATTQHSATQAAEQALALSTNRYKGGLVTYLEVITEQNLTLANQRADVAIMRRRMDASVQLIKALGGSWDVSKLPQT